MPVVLPEHGEIQFGEGVALRHAALVENGCARPLHEPFALLVTGQFAGEVGFHAGADVGRAAGVDRPMPLFVLLAFDVAGEFAEFFRVALVQKLQEQDVLAFEDGVAFEFGYPVAVGFLSVQQIVLRVHDGVAHGLHGDRFDGK